MFSRRFLFIFIFLFGLTGCATTPPNEELPPDIGSGLSFYYDDGTYVAHIVDGQFNRLISGEPVWVYSDKGFYATLAIGVDNVGYTSSGKYLYFDDNNTSTLLGMSYDTPSKYAYFITDLEKLLGKDKGDFDGEIIFKAAYQTDDPHLDSLRGFYSFNNSYVEAVFSDQGQANFKDEDDLFTNSAHTYASLYYTHNYGEVTMTAVGVTKIPEDQILSKYGFMPVIERKTLYALKTRDDGNRNGSGNALSDSEKGSAIIWRQKP